jgi:hypothetical protein
VQRDPEPPPATVPGGQYAGALTGAEPADPDEAVDLPAPDPETAEVSPPA